MNSANLPLANGVWNNFSLKQGFMMRKNYLVCLSLLPFFVSASDKDCDITGRLQEGRAPGRHISGFGSYSFQGNLSAVAQIVAPQFAPSLNIPVCDQIRLVGKRSVSEPIGGISLQPPKEFGVFNALAVTNQTGLKLTLQLQNAHQFIDGSIHVMELGLGQDQLLDVSVAGVGSKVALTARVHDVRYGKRTLAWANSPNGKVEVQINWTDLPNGKRLLSASFGSPTGLEQPVAEAAEIHAFPQLDFVNLGSVRPSASLQTATLGSYIVIESLTWIRPSDL